MYFIFINIFNYNVVYICLSVISKIQQQKTHFFTTVISKDDSVQSVIKWMRNGASDYLIKPIRPKDL